VICCKNVVDIASLFIIIIAQFTSTLIFEGFIDNIKCYKYTSKLLSPNKSVNTNTVNYSQVQLGISFFSKSLIIH